MPYVALDFKDEELWDLVGNPPMRRLTLDRLPGKRGFYRLSVYPGQEEQLEDWLWKVWRRGKIGLFCDEVSLIQNSKAFKAILRQGRSKLIPVISCTQRPVDCDREVFTEAQHIFVFGLSDDRDYKIVKGFTRNAPVDQPLKRHWSYWYDAKQDRLFTLRPCPPPDTIAATIRAKVPYSWALGA